MSMWSLNRNKYWWSDLSTHSLTKSVWQMKDANRQSVFWGFPRSSCLLSVVVKGLDGVFGSFGGLCDDNVCTFGLIKRAAGGGRRSTGGGRRLFHKPIGRTSRTACLFRWKTVWSRQIMRACIRVYVYTCVRYTTLRISMCVYVCMSMSKRVCNMANFQYVDNLL